MLSPPQRRSRRNGVLSRRTAGGSARRTGRCRARRPGWSRGRGSRRRRGGRRTPRADPRGSSRRARPGSRAARARRGRLVPVGSAHGEIPLVSRSAVCSTQSRRGGRWTGSAAPSGWRRRWSRCRAAVSRPARTSPRSVAATRRSWSAPQDADLEPLEERRVQLGSAEISPIRPGSAARAAGAEDGRRTTEHLAQVVSRDPVSGSEVVSLGGEHRLVHQVGLARPAAVDRGLGGAGCGGDRGDGEVGVADLLDEVGGRAQHGAVDARGRADAGRRLPRFITIRA